MNEINKHFIKKVLLIICSLSLSISLNGQTDFSLDYTLLKCQAPIPSSILTSSSKKSKVDIEEKVDKKSGRRDRKKKTEFIIESNYIIDRLLRSHLLLFNTPLNRLSESVLKNLLKKEPDLYDGIDLYIVKSSAVNAFATDRGDIFLTMGLLARLKTEAELAFILAHEVIHYKEKHNIETFTEHAEIDEKNSQNYRESINTLLKKSNYSQSLETIADKKGLVYFAEANYTFDDVIHVFDMLELSHTAIYNISVNKSIFELNHIKIDAADWLSEVPRIRRLEKEEEEYQTHPDIDSRKDALDENRTYYPVKGRAPYQVKSKEEFTNYVKVAQFELLQVLLEEKAYTKALYLCYVLKTQYPNNVFLKKNFAYALYGLAEYALLGKLDQVLYTHESIQGEWERINNLFDVLSPKEIAIIAGAFCWEIHLAYPKDEKIKLMARDLIEDIVIYKVEDPLHYFAKAPIDTAILNSTSSFSRFGFADYMSDSTFIGHLEKGIIYKARRKERKKEENTAEYRKKKKKERIRGKSIGAKKIVVVNPFFLKGSISYSNGIKLDYKSSENLQKSLDQYIKETAKSTKLNTDILDINNLKKDNQIEILNDIHIIERWTDDFTGHPGYIIATNHNEAIKICNKYNADYFVHTGFISVQYKGKRKILQAITASYGYYLLGYLSPATSPYMFYRTFRQENETYYYLKAINMRNYNLDLHDSNWIELNSKPELLKSHLYWSFNQLKKNKK